MGRGVVFAYNKSPELSLGSLEAFYDYYRKKEYAWGLSNRKRGGLGTLLYGSLDAGRTWQENLELLVDDTWSHYDCGYPTAEIIDDVLIIAWYVNQDGSQDLKRDRQCRTLCIDLRYLDLD